MLCSAALVIATVGLMAAPPPPPSCARWEAAQQQPEESPGPGDAALPAGIAVGAVRHDRATVVAQTDGARGVRVRFRAGPECPERHAGPVDGVPVLEAAAHHHASSGGVGLHGVGMEELRVQEVALYPL